MDEWVDGFPVRRAIELCNQHAISHARIYMRALNLRLLGGVCVCVWHVR